MKRYIITFMAALIAVINVKADNVSVSDQELVENFAKTVWVNLSNTERNYVSFQMDLTLPDGVCVNKEGCGLTERIIDEDQELIIGKIGDNKYRLTSTSFSLTPISGTKSTIINLSLIARKKNAGGVATLSNIIFVTNTSKRVAMNDVSFNIIVHPIIEFADAEVKSICVSNWDNNGDGQLDTREAASVVNLNNAFKGNTTINTFEEFQYFAKANTQDAFNGCSALTSIILPNVNKIGIRAFYQCSSLESVIIPEGVPSIELMAFAGCRALTTVSIASSVKTIGTSAFSGCIALTTVNIANGVSNIYTKVFENCISLKNIVIPKSVTKIEPDAFKDCSLETITVESETPISISSTTFATACYDATLYVPAGSKAAYKADYNWKNFKKIVDGTEEPSIIVNGFEYLIISEDDNTAKVVGGPSEGDIEIPSSFVYNDETYSVKAIDDGAFYGYSKIKSIMIPNSVTSIGNYAFNGCIGLTSLEIPNSVITIGSGAFKNCTKLLTVTVENPTPVSIDQWTFSDRANVTLYVPKGSKAAYEAAAYWKEFKEIIESVVFSLDKTELTIAKGQTEVLTVTCPSSWTDKRVTWESTDTEIAIVSSIGEVTGVSTGTATIICTSVATGAMATCEVTVEDVVKEFSKNNIKYRYDGNPDTYTVSVIGNSLSGGNGTIDLVIPEEVTYEGTKYAVTEVGDGAFDRCYALKSVVLPSGIKKLSDRVFRFCSYMASIQLPEGLEQIGTMEFGSAMGAFHGCSKLSEINLPSTLTLIGRGTFSYCTSLKSLILPNSVTTIGSNAFDYCSGLSNVVLSENIVTIALETFRGCSSLTSITIPVNVTSINNSAFNGCNSLTSVIVNWMEPISISSNTFPNSGNITLYIPTGCKAVYESANYWKDFKEIVESVSAEITLNKSVTIIEKGKTEVLTATIKPATLDQGVTWESSNTSVATVSSAGKVTGVKAGTATITCTSKATGMKATCEVTVGYVKLDQTESVLEKSKTMTLKATVYPSSLEDKSVTWESSDTKIATVTSDGKVKGVKTGTATITCTSVATGLSTTCKVTVGYVKLDQSEVILEKAKTMTLKATVYPSTLTDKSVTWESSDTKIATVSSDGKVKGVKTGTATITCTSVATGLSTTCEVTVGSVKLDRTEVTINKGKTVTLKATVYPSTLEDMSVTWTSSDESVATVSSAGKVKGVKAGTATITCTSNATGLSTTCEVLVGYVKLNQTEVTVKKGKTVTLKATVYPSNLEDRSVTWTSSDESVATVSSAGKVKGVKAGTAIITCTSNATGLKTTCEVLVGYVILDQTEVTVKKGKTVTLKATVYPSTLEDRSVIWTSSDESVATVTSAGKVKGVKAGTAIITCTSVATGHSITCKVTVEGVVKEFSIDNIKYRYDGNPNTYTVSVIGNSLNDESGTMDLVIPEKVTYEGTEYTVTEVGDGAFDRCYALKSVVLPSGIKKLSDRAFRYCIDMVSIQLPEGLEQIGTTVFESEMGAFHGCSKLSEINLPCTLTLIGRGTFSYCSSLTSLIVPNSVTTIGSNAFDYCSGLSNVVLSENIATIALETFRGCSSLTSITIPVNVTSINSFAFDGCNNLTSVIVNWMEPISISSNTFPNSGNITLYIPTGCKAVYESANCWKDFKEIVEIITLNKSVTIIEKGKTEILTATIKPSTLDRGVTWTSSNTAVATVSSKGKVKGVKTGTATITCTSKATGLSATCEVTVGSVKLDQTEVAVKKGETVTLKATVYPSTLEDKTVTWTSSNTAVATVSSKGKVKGVRTGTVTITCTSVATGLSATCTVTVTSTSGSRSLEGDDDELTGIEENVVAVEPFDVYDLSGRKVLHQVTSLDGLADGVYIVNGKKILKKK